MRLKLFISATLLFILVVGCIPSQHPTETQSSDVQSPNVVVLTPTVISTQAISSSTALPLVTHSGDNWEASQSCVTFYPARPEAYQLKGVAVLRSISSNTLDLSMSLLDLENGTSKEINTSNQSVWDADVLPNGQTLAYVWFNVATSKWELTLVDTSGNVQKVAWSSDNDFVFAGWLNDHQVVTWQYPVYIVVDPYQGSQEKFFPLDFPDFDIHNPVRFFASFDPLLTRAIYKNGDIILLDLSAKTIIARINDSYDRVPIVAWQSSGERVAVVATIPTEGKMSGSPDEIFVVERNGKVRQLTHLYDSFGQILTIDGLSWSPDGEKIAFWLHDGHRNLTLMVADSSTGNVVNYCVLNVTSDSFSVDISAPIWSPDGKHLLVENRYSEDKSKLLVVDLLNKIAFPIAENENPVGWMIKEP